jgi:hypothetical protein
MNAVSYFDLKSKVNVWFRDRGFVLTFSKCFLGERNFFRVICDCHFLNNAGNTFPVDGSIAEQNWRHHSISGWRFSYSLCRNFPSILFRSKVIQEFHACAMVKNFSIFGANMTPKILFANLDTPKRHFLEKICVDWGILVQVAIPVRAVGSGRVKKR